jgi:large subunit ribosomal protein L29
MPKRKETMKKLYDLTLNELNNKLMEHKKELFNLRFQLATGQLDNPLRIQGLKHDIARVKTVIRERELQA